MYLFKQSEKAESEELSVKTKRYIKDGRKQYNMDTYYRKVDNRIMTILVVSYTGFESKVEELLEGFEVY